MYQAICTHHPFVAEVRKVLPYLVTGQLPFVYNGFEREGSDIESDGVFPYRIIDEVTGIVSENK
jgi:hypothetical protein